MGAGVGNKPAEFGGYLLRQGRSWRCHLHRCAKNGKNFDFGTPRRYKLPKINAAGAVTQLSPPRRRVIMMPALPLPSRPEEQAFMTTRITIRPDDWHLHVRDGALLKATLPASAAVFGRAIIMPNLAPPVRTLSDLRAYRARIMAALPAGHAFRPLMTLYLTDDTDPALIDEGAASGASDGGEALSGRCHHQLGQRRHRHRQGRQSARRLAGGGHSATGPRRGHRSGGRYLRPRGRVHRAGAHAGPRTLSRPAHRAGARDDEGSSRRRAFC